MHSGIFVFRWSIVESGVLDGRVGYDDLLDEHWIDSLEKKGSIARRLTGKVRHFFTFSFLFHSFPLHKLVEIWRCVAWSSLFDKSEKIILGPNKHNASHKEKESIRKEVQYQNNKRAKNKSCIVS